MEDEAERIRSVLTDVIDATERVEAGGKPDLRPHELEFPHLYHRAVEALRWEVLRSWSRGDSAFGDADDSEVLSIVAALERVRLHLWPEGEEEIVSRMAEPGAFELLVEVAHDLRSPLNSVLFLSETLRSGHSGEINELQKRQLGLIYSAALGMDSISSDVVELARGGLAYFEDEPSPFSIREVFGTVREMVRPMAEVKGVRFVDRPPRTDLRVGHPVPLCRILLNLVTNALKFTEEGTVTLRATVVERNMLEFSVEDTGPGIEGEKLDKLFRPFRKSRERSGHFFSGSGLGLTIARRLVSAMDGELSVESEPGEGTRFFFRVKMPPPPASG